MSLEPPNPGPSPPESASAPPASDPLPAHRSLWRHRDFLKVWTAQSISQFGDEVTQLALPFVAITILGAGAFQMGVLGTFQFLPFILLVATVGILFSIGNVGVLLGAVTTGPIAWAIPVLIVSGIVSGWSVVVYNVNQRSLRQAITPDRMLGRMTATMRFIVWGTIPIGTLTGGILGELLGLRTVLIIGGLGMLLAFLPVLFSPVRSLQRIPTPELA